MKAPRKLDLAPCSPPWWASTGHAQTILGHLLPSKVSVSLRALDGKRLEISLPDGDRLVARVIEGKSDTVLYLFHGLTGSIEADYMQRTAALGVELGYTVYLVNHRGCGEGHGLARNPYHSGRAEDLSEVIRVGKAKNPAKKHIAVGFSLSANALLLLLSGRRGTTLPDAAIAVNAPIHLENCSIELGRGLNKIYDIRFSTACKLNILSMKKKGLVEKERYKLNWLSNLRDFDSVYTAPAGGFSSREDYYSTCSTHLLLGAITVPTVIITSEDDPIIDYRNYTSATLSSSAILHLEKSGGHLGYISAKPTPLGTNRWLDYATREYLLELGSLI
jgi:uncharacterized protein